MNYLICKLSFESEVHIGNGSLTDACYSIGADTLFSALCHEAIKSGGDASLTYLVIQAKTNKLLISDGFPYIGDKFYIPKPLICENTLSSMEFIPMDLIHTISTEPEKINEEHEIEQFQKLGRRRIHTHIPRSQDRDKLPYYVGTYQFFRENGIYFVIGYEDRLLLEFIKNLLLSLQYTGIGGKKSSGLGRFWFEFQQIEECFEKKLCNKSSSAKWYMTLSVSLPKEDEKECLVGAKYICLKRKGFICSETYTSHMYDEDDVLLKREVEIIKSGACVKQCYKGQIANVNNKKGHDVYRYAMPLYWRLS